MVGWPAETPPATLKNSSPKLGEVPVRAEECVSPAWGAASLLDTLPRPAGHIAALRLPFGLPFGREHFVVPELRSPTRSLSP